ncbi:MAG: carboxypeptidase-like regulatory domain-containing protein, partial [Rhodothermales bacterium]|nr:carboxypeptidase-like regulatory domain-containing protein [Rhodothermales bacterium]
MTHPLRPLCGALALLGLFLLAPLPALAQQTGTIAGTLVDSETGAPLIGASAILEGTATGAATDLDGRFLIPNVEPGTYTVVLSYIGYDPMTVRGVEVRAGETTRIDVALSAEALEVGELVVEAAALTNTEAALLKQRQKAAGVSDAISAEDISRSGSSSAADAMEKVTGASVVAGKYVYVRGLGDRYMSTQLNGASLPSADPDRNTVPLDLFPSEA